MYRRAVCSDIIRGTFKGFALLRQATQTYGAQAGSQAAPQAGPSAPRPMPLQAQPLNRPVYAPGYGGCGAAGRRASKNC